MTFIEYLILSFWFIGLFAFMFFGVRNFISQEHTKNLWFRVEAAIKLFGSDDFFLTCYDFKNKKKLEWRNFTTLPVKDSELDTTIRVIRPAVEMRHGAYQMKANIKLAEELVKQ